MVNLAIFHATLPSYLSSTAQEADQCNLQVAVATAERFADVPPYPQRMRLQPGS